MTDVPSVKGSVIAEVVDDLRKLRARGDITQSQIEAHLDPDQRHLVEQSLRPTEWYPVDFYRRCVELLRAVVGHGRDEYVRERGFNRGNKLMEAGLYQQMEYANRAQVQKHSDPQARFEAYGRDLRLFVTLSGSLLNFSKWSVDVDPDHADRYQITVKEAADYPHILGIATEGMIDAMACQHGLANLWKFERVSNDTLAFRMTRSL